jgi:4-diphosphocytidyl-2-C-methyl-D-erythritol kinase
MRISSLSIYFLISQVVAAFTGPQRPVSNVDRLFSAVSPEAATTTANLQSLTLFSPCKINLFLRIIRKRPDGYHDLASLFQAIGFGDTLELSVLGDDATEDEFTCNMPGVPVDSSNLVLRALALMREKTQVATYFKANLIKQVPAQAGLGGGSANAATALWGANQLMGEPATLEEVRWMNSVGTHVFGCVAHKSNDADGGMVRSLGQ